MTEESIFAVASQKKSASERRAFLDEACAGNTELRSAVESLLQASADAGSFLAHPPLGLEATVATDASSRDTASLGDWSARLPYFRPCDKPGYIGKLVGTAGEYDVVEVVGRGGMGTVLRAFETKLSRVVAVKVMAPELASNPTAVRRFLREATTAAAVHHEHVVAIHAVDESHQPPFLVMQFIEGQTLQQKIDREGALALKHILRIGSQMAVGLAAAHKQGLIHRDVKPSNILLENGVERVKISDFGLARAADDMEMTKTGIIAGTPQYMSPEQAKGEVIDARSDLFSLGSVLYTMCTGRPAFRAESTMGVLRRVCDDTPRPIREVNPEIPAWLESIVNKLLAKNPAERFQSATEVGELLGQCLAHVQNPAIAQLPTGLEAATSGQPSQSPTIAGQSWLRPPWVLGTMVALAAGSAALNFYQARVLPSEPVSLLHHKSWILMLIATGLMWFSLRSSFRRTTSSAQPSAGRFVPQLYHRIPGFIAILLLLLSLGMNAYLLSTGFRRPNEALGASGADVLEDSRHDLHSSEPSLANGSVAKVNEPHLSTVATPLPKVALVNHENWGDFHSPNGKCQIERGPHHIKFHLPAANFLELQPLVGAANNAPRLTHRVTGDFLLQATVLAFPRAKWVETNEKKKGVAERSAGLVVIGSQTQMVTLTRASISATRAGAPILQKLWYESEKINGNDAFSLHDFGDPPTYLQIERRGQKLHLRSCENGIDWVESTIANMSLPDTLSIGLLATQAFSGEFEAVFQDVRFRSSSVLAAASSTEESWLPLFNGLDLTGWKAHPTRPGNWRVENGILIGSGPSALSHLFTERDDFSDFHLRVEMKVSAGSDSGLHARCRYASHTSGDYLRGYEVNVMTTGASLKTGTIYDPGDVLAPVVVDYIRPDEWFVLELIARGNHLVVRLNDQTAADCHDPKSWALRGRISLQQMGKNSAVQFRKVEIKELKKDAATAPASNSIAANTLTPSSVWKAPENADPSQVLKEAKADAAEGRLDVALAKHVWYHEHAVGVGGASEAGVRLSGALADWADLAERYPPALAKLKAVRDQAAVDVMRGQGISHIFAFTDLSSINHLLEEDEHTRKVFEDLHKEFPRTASQLFIVALPTLVRTKAYRLCDPYLQPDVLLNLYLSMYRGIKEVQDSRKADGAKGSDNSIMDTMFQNQVSILVALLVVNERKDEAEKVADDALQELDTPAFRNELERALQGKVPDPWPPNPRAQRPPQTRPTSSNTLLLPNAEAAQK